MRDRLRIGTSGWHYPAGKGTWNGVFYPPTRGRARTFDELSFFAEHFNTVEINSTFYGQPRPAVSRSWVERTPPGFEFSVKLYQKFTHPKMFAERIKAALPERQDAESHQDVVAELARPNLADLDEFKRGIEPLASSGKLGALLAQFPPSFKNSDIQRAYLTALLKDLKDYPVAVELRHASWSDAFADTLALLNPPELPAQRQGLLLPPAPRSQRRPMVAPRQVGRQVQLSLLSRGAARVQRDGRGDSAIGKEDLSLREQSFLGQVGGQRRDDQAPARRAGSR
jgi:uncharacterized protein YecE (DUF72 family)